MTENDHTLVVTLDDLNPDEQAEYDAETPEDRKVWDRDRMQVAIECSGVTRSCRTWWECRKPCDDERARLGLDPDSYDEHLWEFGEAHGVEHERINGEWMTPSDPPTCIGHTLDNAYESAQEVAAFDLDCKPGRYQIDLDTDDFGVTVRLATPPEGLRDD